MQPQNNNDNTYGTIQPYTVEDIAPLQQQAYAPIEDYDQDEFVKSSGPNPFANISSNRMFLFGIIGFIAIGLIVFGFLLFQASGNRNTGSSVTPTPTTPNNGGTTGGTNQNVFIQFWGMYIPEAAMQPLIDEYETINTNVQIDYADKQTSGTSATASNNYRTELNRVINSKDAAQQPDIFMVENSWSGDYQPYASNATGISSSQFSSAYFPAATTDFTLSGNVFGVPLWFDSLAIVYNKEILAAKSITEPPKEWTAFKNASKAITTTDISGFAIGRSATTEFDDQLFWLLLRQYGVNITTSGQLTFATQPSSVDALAYVQDFLKEQIWKTTFGNASTEFLKGKVGMIAVPSWRLREILRSNEQFSLGLDIGVSSMPQISSQNATSAWAQYWGAMVNASRPQSAESWKFLLWLSEPTQIRKLSQNIKKESGYFGIIYPRVEMLSEMQNETYLFQYAQGMTKSESIFLGKGSEAKKLVLEAIDSGSATQARLTQLQNSLIQLLGQRGVLQ